MNLDIEHRTRYTYSDKASYTIQQLRLTPQDGCGQRVKRWEIRVNGNLQRFVDAHGNIAHTLVIDMPHDEIHIVASGQVETGLDEAAHDNRLPLPVYLRQTALTEADAALRQFAGRYSAYLQDTSKLWLEDMMHAILKKVPYSRGRTSVATPAAEPLPMALASVRIMRTFTLPAAVTSASRRVMSAVICLPKMAA